MSTVCSHALLLVLNWPVLNIRLSLNSLGGVQTFLPVRCRLLSPVPLMDYMQASHAPSLPLALHYLAPSIFLLPHSPETPVSHTFFRVMANDFGQETFTDLLGLD